MAGNAPVDPAVLAAALDPAAPAPVAVEEPKAEEKVEKSEYADLIERLTKGDFGNTDEAHNGNELDKSTPMGEGASFKVQEDLEHNVDGAEARVKRSSRVRTEVPAPPTNLNKSDDEADEDEEIMKSDDEINEEDIYGALVDGEGAEGYVPVAEASEAIQYLTDTFAKAFTHLSAQVSALSAELHDRVDGIEKSQSLIREAQAALLKSAAPVKAEPITKSLATPAPASGIVVVAPKAEETKKDAPTGGVLFKSITKAMQTNQIAPELGDRLLRLLDSQGPAKVWENLSSENREKIAAQAAN